MTRLSKEIRSFSHALRGCRMFFHTENHARFHLTAGIAVVILAAVLGFSIAEWSLIVLCIGLVFATEMLNTAIERLADVIEPASDPKIGLVKDIAAGAVLIASLTAAVVGMLLFLPRVIEWLLN